ncbi:hypothetical protein ACFW1A_37950 [Kitasatospora sp. NPDC058965]|uniref:hypothetical protein n=1 Tax=Kitasatospora sp. NPDC058965 TaxID=3346682 RepID=UPI0036C2872A
MPEGFDRPGSADPGWTGALRAFGLPAAVLAHPRPQWRRTAGVLAADGVVHQVEVGYADAAGAHHAQVVTHRVPPGVRVYSTPDPASVLFTFLANAAPDELIPLPGGHYLSAGSLLLPDGQLRAPGSWLELPGEPSTGPGRLVVDGSAVGAAGFHYADYAVTTAVLGATTVVVVSAAAVHDEAVHLTFELPAPAA